MKYVKKKEGKEKRKEEKNKKRQVLDHFQDCGKTGLPGPILQERK